MRNNLYLTALMRCLLTSLLKIKTVKGLDPKRKTDTDIAALTFEQLKGEVEHVRAQVVANDVSPVVPKGAAGSPPSKGAEKVALASPSKSDYWEEFPYTFGQLPDPNDTRGVG
jgi:hypothetical protein